MLKRLFALFLTLCLLCTLAPAALALDPRGDLQQEQEGFYAKQQTGNTCTLAAAAMLVRRRAYLDGVEDWQESTESRLRRVAWSRVGLSHQFTISGITVHFETFLPDVPVESQLLVLLAQHPEGIIAYDSRKPHAVLVTDYTDGVFYCSDPSVKAPAGRIPADEATIDIARANIYWYVSADTNRPQGTGVSLTAHDLTYPTRLPAGTAFALRGQLTSPSNITQVQLQLVTDAGIPVQTLTAQPEATSYDLAELTAGLRADALKIGSYRMILTADDEYGGRITLNRQLVVGSTASYDRYNGCAPVLSDVNAVELTESGFDVECTAVAPVAGQVSVLYSVWADGEQFAPGLVAERDGDVFTTHVSANADLLGLESLLVNITVLDADGNTARSALLVQISPDGGGDVVVDQKLV